MAGEKFTNMPLKCFFGLLLTTLLHFQSSLSVIALETDISSAVALGVIREGGTFGDVSANWEVTGDHIEGEITPSSGEVESDKMFLVKYLFYSYFVPIIIMYNYTLTVPQYFPNSFSFFLFSLCQVVFAEGVSAVTLAVQVHPDVLPELNEVTVITLTEITQNGVPPGGDITRGAQLLPGQTQAVITVQANDAPHGVVVWSAAVVNATEQEGTDSIVQLTLLREFGSIGDIIITYR